MTKAMIDKIKKYFQNQKNILAVYLYGSFASKQVTKLSDIDFGIVMKKPISESQAFDLRLKYMGELDNLLRKDLKYEYIDAVILNIATPLLKQQAIINGIRIYCVDIDKCVKFETDTLKEYDDAMYLRKTYYHYLNKQAKTGILGEKHVFKR